MLPFPRTVVTPSLFDSNKKNSREIDNKKENPLKKENFQDKKI